MEDATRRGVLRSLGLAAGGTLVPTAVSATPTDRPALDGPPDRNAFPQGVASGDPTPSGAIVWTRVAPDAYDPAESLSVAVAEDDEFDRVVGVYGTGGTGAGRDYTVKVDLDGRLDPGTYYYRFQHDGRVSPVGRLRTLPPAGSSPASVSFAVANCQDYRNGYYGAYDHIAREDVDYLLHLGDFIYEHGGPSRYPGRDIHLPSGHDIAMGLDDYRHLHRTYRTDSALQSAMAAHTLIATWDDHEIVNDRFYSYADGRPYAGEGSHPRNDDADFMRQLFAAGVRAWWEYTPARVRYDPTADLLDSLGLYRSFSFGDLLDLVVTDERLFRSAPPSSDLPGPLATTVDADGREDATMFGDRQRRWFEDAVGGSNATWTAWANEVLHMSVRADFAGERVYDADSWAGYGDARSWTASVLSDAQNPVTLTGDLHSTAAGYLKPRYGDDGGGERVGVEFLTPAMTSANLQEVLDLPRGEWPALLLRYAVRRENPHVEFFDSHYWGYATATFTRDDATFTAYSVDKSARENASKRTLASYRVPAGRVALRG